jgi:hypothetical protein
MQEPVLPFPHGARAEKPPRASSTARMPACAAQPGCMRLVHVPFGQVFDDAARHRAREALGGGEHSGIDAQRRRDAAAAPIAPITAVGWKPALWIFFGATRLARHITSQPTAMPSSRSGPEMR